MKTIKCQIHKNRKSLQTEDIHNLEYEHAVPLINSEMVVEVNHNTNERDDSVSVHQEESAPIVAHERSCVCNPRPRESDHSIFQVEQQSNLQAVEDLQSDDIHVQTVIPHPDQLPVTTSSESEPPVKKIRLIATLSDTCQGICTLSDQQDNELLHKNVQGEKEPHPVPIVGGLPSASKTDNCLSGGELSQTISSTLENQEIPRSTQSFKQEDINNAHSNNNLQSPKTKCRSSGCRKVNGRRRHPKKVAY